MISKPTSKKRDIKYLTSVFNQKQTGIITLEITIVNCNNIKKFYM